jgi:hypothetical protein
MREALSGVYLGVQPGKEKTAGAITHRPSESAEFGLKTKN